MVITTEQFDKLKTYTIQLKIPTSQIDMFEYILKKEKQTRNILCYKIIADYCERKMKFYQMQEDIEKEFIEEYKQMRKVYLETINNFERLRKDMLQMLPINKREVLKPFKKKNDETTQLRLEEDELKKLDLQILEEKEMQDSDLYDYDEEEEEDDFDYDEIHHPYEKVTKTVQQPSIEETEPFEMGDLHG